MKIKAYRFESENDKKCLEDYYGKCYFALIPTCFSSGYLFSSEDVQKYRKTVDRFIGSWTSADPKSALKDSRFFVIPWKALNKTQTKQTNMKLGDTVKCVKATGSSFLRTWKTYELVDQNQHGNWQVKELATGALSAHWYKEDRFSVISPAKKVAKKVAKKAINNRIDLSKNYKTKDGEAVRLYTIGDDSTFPVVGAVQDSDGRWRNESWTIEGKFLESGHDSYDLVEVPTTISKTLDGGLKFTVYNDLSILLEQNGRSTSLSKEDFAELTSAFAQMK